MLVLARVFALAIMFAFALSLVDGLHPSNEIASATIAMNPANLNFIIVKPSYGLPMRQSSESVRALQNMAARIEGTLGSLPVLWGLTNSRRGGIRGESAGGGKLQARGRNGALSFHIFHLLTLPRASVVRSHRFHATTLRSLLSRCRSPPLGFEKLPRRETPGCYRRESFVHRDL